jgi:hypothetical protein
MIDPLTPPVYIHNMRKTQRFSSFLTKQAGGGNMNLTMGVILDELAAYKPVIHKMGNPEAEFRQFHYYNRELAEFSPEYLYVLGCQENDAVFGKEVPRHAIVAGDIPGALTEKTDALDTLILKAG